MPAKKPNIKKPKINAFSRGRALVYLSKGRTIDETVKLLMKRHPEHSFEEIKAAYFPKKGIYSISKFENVDRKQINRGYSELRQKDAAHRESMRKRHKDPGFAAANRERMRELNKDPEFAAANRERMRELNKDPEFEKKRLEGIAKYWNTYRLRIAEYMDEMQIGSAWQYVGGDGFRKIATTTKTPEKKFDLKQRRKIINDALKSLSENERNIVDLVFGFSDKEMSLGDASSVLGLDFKSAERILKSALSKLAKNNALRDLV